MTGHDMGGNYIADPLISVVLPVLAPTEFHIAMTEFCIRTLRTHASQPFELIVVEAEHDFFENKTLHGIDQYIRFNPKVGGVKEINAGVRAAKGEFIVVGGNDVIVPQDWDKHLLQPFERSDCGMSSLSAKEPGAFIGPPHPLDYPAYVEGFFSPFMMFKKGWEYDEAFRRIYQDSDLVLRMYEKGLRAYRSNRGICHHFGSVTNTTVNPEEHNRQVAPDEKLFYQRWGNCPYMMFGMIRSASLQYGREWEAWHRPIHLHHDPRSV